MAERSCDSCGATGEDLEEVRRVYVTPEAWDREARVDVLEEPEHWCATCCAHYPHQPVGG